MTDESAEFTFGSEPLPDATGEKLDLLWREFEQAWQVGRCPRIPEFLDRWEEPQGRAELLENLLLCELHYRRARGEQPTAEEYEQAFPNDVSLVRRVHACQLDVTPSASNSNSSLTRVPSNSGDRVGESATVPDKIGRYHVERVLGEGGFGRVFLAVDQQLKRRVAIKVPHRKLISQAEDAQSYLAEAQTLASLDHPYIVPVYDVGSTDEFPCYVVSKYVDGTDLSQRLKNNPISYTAVARLVATVAAALHYAHKCGLVHRDIKPGNILLDASNMPYVADFGLALRDSDLGHQARYAGTPAYMSPEQARGESHRVDGRSDIYSLGAVLYELLVGRRTFTCESEVELLDRIATQEPRPLRQIDDSVPRELERICLKALSLRAGERYTTAADMSEDLRCFLSEYRPSEHGSTQIPLSASPDASTHVGGNLDTGRADSAARRICVVPKGLRSFDQHDADFFLELLPGPRDRDGRPQSVRFWLTRVEETDADKTFPVGVLYGPSGSGKSSLMKAAILPRLREHVVAIYLEATQVGMERRLLSALRKEFPELSKEGGLAGTMLALRRGRGVVPRGKKVVVIVDQFEQWLHTNPNPRDCELLRSLRQCDGGRLQCILLVRSDFWMAVTRFMHELEIRLIEGHNSISFDLFPAAHASKVLAAFGHAFGQLPARSAASSRETEFLRHAVSAIAEDGQVICVRLALFAEMFKNKAWTIENLRTFGGAEGLGAAFLDQTFVGTTAPPEHRLHQKAARRVLRALLPEAGVAIRSHVQSYDELLLASGYANRPGDFNDLMQILDGELRIITPADRTNTDENGPESRKYRSYQLTHDFLIRSIRSWLNRKQRETRGGRAELCLSERSRQWNIRPEDRYLPTWREHVTISCLTDRTLRTESQRKMMQASSRYYRKRLAVAALLLIGGFAIGCFAWEREKARRAHDLVERLLDAEVAKVESVIEDIEPYRYWADPLLYSAVDGNSAESTAYRNASLALLPVDPKQVLRLRKLLVGSNPGDFVVVRDVLKAHEDVLREWLWALAQSDREGSFRAGCALAAYGPDDDRWQDIAPRVTAQLISQNALDLKDWLEALRPVASLLADELLQLPMHQFSPAAVQVLVEYGRDDPKIAALAADLVKVATHEDAPQRDRIVFAQMLAEYWQHEPKIAVELELILQQELVPRWEDVPLEPGWQQPAKVAVTAIEESAGMLHERFAFCQKMAIEGFQEIADAMELAGYRPTKFRPYRACDSILVAAIWVRDGRKWRVLYDAAEEDVLVRDGQLHEEGFQPADVTTYYGISTAGPAHRYAALWVESIDEEPEFKLTIGSANAEYKQASLSAQHSGYARVTWALTGSPGSLYHCSLWEKTELEHAIIGGMDWQSAKLHTPGWVQLDVQVKRPPFSEFMNCWYVPPAARSTPLVDARVWTRTVDIESNGVVFSRDGGTVYATDNAGVVRGWRADDGSEALRIQNGKSRALGIDVSPNNRYLAVCGGSEVTIHDLEDPGTSIILRGHAGEVWSVDYSANGGRLVSGDSTGTVIVWDTNSGRQLSSWNDGAELIWMRGVQFNPNGSLVAGPARGGMKIRNANDGSEQLSLELDTCPHGIAFDSRGDRLAIACSDGSVVVWNLNSDRIEKEFADDSFPVYAVDFAPDDRTLLSTNQEGAVRLWDIQHALSASRLPEPRSGVPAAVFGPAGRNVASTCWDGKIRLWREFGDPGGTRKERTAGRHYTAVFRFDSDWESTVLNELSIEDHRDQCWHLSALGYRPASISVDEIDSKSGVVCASVWHRPFGSKEQRRALAKRKANTASALLRMKQATAAWKQFRFNPKPGSRSLLIQRVPTEEGPQLILNRLDVEKDAGIRRALILALGRFLSTDFSAAGRKELVDRLESMYRDEADPGVHGALAWLLRKWGFHESLDKIDMALSSRGPQGDRQWYVNGQGQTMAVVPKGKALVGTRREEAWEKRAPWEGAMRWCRIDHTYAIAAAETSVAQYLRFVGENPHTDSEELRNEIDMYSSASGPISYVSWYQAAEYCNWLSGKEGIPRDQWCYLPNDDGKFAEGMRLASNALHREGYRLPSEAEWEIACRAGTTTSRFFGEPEELLSHYAWWAADWGMRLRPCAQLMPNDFGLFDTLGNVREMCHQRWDASLTHLAQDYEGTTYVENATWMVQKGGAHIDTSNILRATTRAPIEVTFRTFSVGFRVARTLR